MIVNKTIYNTIGVKYNEHRNADKRILYAIKELLDLPTDSTIRLGQMCYRTPLNSALGGSGIY